MDKALYDMLETPKLSSYKQQHLRVRAFFHPCGKDSLAECAKCRIFNLETRSGIKQVSQKFTFIKFCFLFCFFVIWTPL
jgi:hypothetical protein